MRLVEIQRAPCVDCLKNPVMEFVDHSGDVDRLVESTVCESCYVELAERRERAERAVDGVK